MPDSGQRPWIAVDGGYSNREFLKPAQHAGFVVVARLRRDAELTGKFPTKSVLGSLEPFLIDIANLPDKATARDVQQIKDRVQRTEIVAELRSY